MILFIYPVFSSFVRKDFEILKKRFKVKKYHYLPKKKIFPLICKQLKLFFWLLLNIRKASVIYIWFADYHSFLPLLFARIFRKKGIIIVGGYDAVSIPNLKFGAFYKPLRSQFAKFSYKLATHILPVDESLVQSVNTYIDPAGLKIGFKHFVSNISAEVITVPTGYDSENWKRPDGVIIEPFVLTVGCAFDMTTFKRKGFDFIMDLANYMQDIKFVIIGLRGEMYQYAMKKKTANVEAYSFLPGNELIEFFQRAKVFCQFSLSEGLPNTLCEAMLCECIPVGSNVNGIPKAIGDCGYILETKDLIKAKELVKKALCAPEEMGKLARQRIMKLFPASKRESELVGLIKKISQSEN